MHPQPSKNTYNRPSKSLNNTTQNRTNQTSAGKGNRQHNFSTNTPRNRLIPTTAIFPPLHGGVVMGQFNPGGYPTRTVNIQQCQFGAQIYSQICYPLYVPQLPQQQPQQQQNTNATTVMGVVNVQPGTFVSRPAGNQPTMPFAITPTNSLLNVANSTPTQSLNVAPFSQTQTLLPYGLNHRANSYGTVPTINASGPQNTSSPLTFSAAVLQNNTRIAQVPQRQPRVKAKLRSHALEIIHPITNKNVLQDLNNDQEIMFPPAEKTISQIQDNNLIKNSKSKEKIQFKDLSLNRDSATNQIFEDTAQQAKQITKHDVCVEIIPIQQNSLSNSVIKVELPLASLEKPIPKNFSLNSAEEQEFTVRSLKLPESNSKDNCNQLALEEICITTNAEGRPEDVKVIFNPGSIEQNLLEPEEKLDFDHSKLDKNIEIGAMVSQNSQDFDEDKNDIEIPKKVEFQPQSFQADVQICSFVGGITQETKTDDQFENSKTFKNVHSFTVNDDPEENYIEEELLISRPIEFDRDTIVQNVNPFSASEQFQGVYCNEKAILSIHKDRKKYSHNQLMQLRYSKQSCKLPEVKNFEIFAPINLMPGFVGRSPLNRPLVKAYGYAKHINKYNFTAYPGAGSTISDSTNDRNKSKPMIYLNLALNQDVQLNEAHNAWKPRVLTTTSDKLQDNLQPEKAELIRKVRGILNKLTPEKFDPLVEEILKLKIDNLDKMEAVMNLVFEKAIDEPNFSVSYARLCHRLISEVNAGDDERIEPDTKSNLSYFRNALLHKTEREFTHYVAKINAKEESLKPLREKYENCQDRQEQIELEALLNEEERKIRRRSGGTVRFIGELFKISILNGRIIHSCIEALLKDPQNEDMLECLCKLLSTVGQKFEQTYINHDDQCKTYSLKSIIKRMQRIATRSERNKISSRIRFMLLDVIDLRKKKWQSTRDEAPQTMQQIEKDINDTNQIKPVGLTNSFKEGKNVLKSETIVVAKRLERANGVAQNDVKLNQKELKSSGISSANEWQVQTAKSFSLKNLDSSKLGGLKQVDLNNKKMGAASLFQWKKSPTQPQTLGTNSFAVLSSTDSERHRNRPKIIQQVFRESERGDCLHSKSGFKEMAQPNPNSGKMRCNAAFEKGASTSLDLKAKEIYRTNPNSSTLKSRKDPKHGKTKLVFNEPSSNEIKIFKSVLTEMLQNAMNFTTIDEDTVACITRLEEGSKCPLLYYLLTDYLHLCNIKSASRNLLSQLVIHLIENKYLNLEHFQLAYTNFIEQASDLIVDIPELWLYIFEFTGPLLVKNIITFNDLWQPQLMAAGPSTLSQKFLKSFIQYTSREVGPNFMRSLWQKNHLKWSDFMDEKEIENFIKNHEFGFIENANEPFVPKNSLKETPENLQKRVKNRIQHLLKEGCHPDLIMDYINGNILQVNRTFIHNLSVSLVQFCLEGRGNCKLDLRKFQNIILPLLRHYLNSQEDLELECLKAINALMDIMELSESMWESICSELSAADVIAQETFNIWHNFKEP